MDIVERLRLFGSVSMDEEGRLGPFETNPLTAAAAAEIERLQAIVTTVDDLHSPRLAHDTCLACDHNWPCPTHLLIHPEEARRG